ncbi:MAG TPA: OmpA family protein [Polyangia bacterium]|nr:OmpA family protein [Polyangia bacterium]
MRHRSNMTIAAMVLAASAAASAAPPAAEKSEFQLQDTHTAKEAHGATASKIKPTRTEAAMKLFVVDKDKGPVKGVAIFMTGPDGTKYYAEPTDSAGYTEMLVPVGKKYDITYLSLGRHEIAATVPVADEPSQSVKLTLRYKRENDKPFVLSGVNFDTAKATIRPGSFKQLDEVVDFMNHKKEARVEISGHTDNVGNPQANKTLSQRRAQACLNYIVSKGIDKSRLTAVGEGDERPVAPNDSDEGRQRNRRIEARELM